MSEKESVKQSDIIEPITSAFNEGTTYMEKFFNDFLGKENINYINENKLLLSSILIISLIFIWVATYGYDIYVKPMIKNNYEANKEFIPDNDNNEITIYYFYTTWCPYCKKARGEWEQFKNNLTNSEEYNKKYNIVYNDIDCELAENKDLANKFNITSYPTIKLVLDGTTYNYDAKPDHNLLMRFFEGSLPEDKALVN